MALGRLHAWRDNVRRLLTPRQRWDAGAEFAYYAAAPDTLAAQRARQVQFAREGQFLGLRVARSLGVLDTDLVAGARAVEIGAGECVLSQALARLGAAEVWAVDAVPRQIWAAAAHAEKDPVRAPSGAPVLRCVLASATDLPLADGSCDLLLANLVLHHIRPVDAVCAEARRVLRPGGRFRAFEPAPLAGLLAHEVTSENEAPLWPRAIVKALREAGFIDVRAEYYWSRLDTGRLGPLSPGYRVLATAPGGPAPRTEAPLRRPLQPAGLPGLQLDSGCAETPLGALIAQQIEQIRGAAR